MREPNSLLDALLDEAGMSRAGLAARVNELGRTRHSYDHTSVGRWLAAQRPRGEVPDLIRGILSSAVGRALTLDDIGFGSPAAASPGAMGLDQFVNRAPALWRSDRPGRDAQTPVTSGLNAIAPVWEWENPPEDSDVSRHGSTRVDLQDVACIQVARDRYEQMYRRVGGVATRGRVVFFLNEYAAPVLRGSYSDAVGRKLHRTLGGLVSIAGICAYDADAQGLAQGYFHQALRLAKASGDRPFGAYVIGLMTNQAMFLRDYHRALAFAEAALRAAGNDISPALAADLNAMKAKSYGRIKEQASAHRAMASAERAADRIGERDEPPETGYVQPGLVDTQLAETLLSLGDLGAANAYAQQAADLATHPRGQVNRLVTVTRVAVARREIDRAAGAASSMLDRAEGMESVRLNNRFRAIANALRPEDAECAREVVERIDTNLSVPL
jgi:tetratricopeptide (TPR) repeat protein